MRSIEEEMKGKVAVITGGNTGIGYGCAKVFAEAGVNVVIAARRKDKGEEAAAKISALGGGECTFFQCDVADPEQVKALVEFAVTKYGRLDTMINNAGYNPLHFDACDMSIESYQQVLATNLMGEFYGCKYAIPHLRKTKGSIINMSSILSKVGQESPKKSERQLCFSQAPGPVILPAYVSMFPAVWNLERFRNTTRSMLPARK